MARCDILLRLKQGRNDGRAETEQFLEAARGEVRIGNEANTVDIARIALELVELDVMQIDESWN